ncbi:MAG: hypothetical protein HW406_2064 [Candidatus Brocadiaceae bacterium]|nr:hypothetical protein [Candidatus Brocadiaceae bacterium]
MKFITHKIDTYILRECPSDKHDLIIEATKVIDLYSGENHVASAYFTEENFCSPDAIFSEGKIHFYAPVHQYEAVTEQLNMGKSIYVAWTPLSGSNVSGYGEAYFFNEFKTTFEFDTEQTLVQ